MGKNGAAMKADGILAPGWEASEAVKMLRERIKWNFVGIPAVDKEKISSELAQKYGEFMWEKYKIALPDFLVIRNYVREEGIVEIFSETEAFRKIAREHGVSLLDLKVRLHRSVANARRTLASDAAKEAEQRKAEMARRNMATQPSPLTPRGAKARI